jgi:LysM repeat protein
MKTTNNPILKKRAFRIGGVALTVLMALSMMAAALPQTALAAGPTTATCAYQHTVKKSDTKNTIADTYGLKWWEIAKANNLPANPKPVVGTTLCIPTQDWAASAYTGTMTATAVGKKLSVTMSGFAVRSVWNVKVKDPTGTVSGFYKVGRIIAPVNGSVTGIYKVPQDLLETPRLTVCVTNADSSKTICTEINHTL